MFIAGFQKDGKNLLLVPDIVREMVSMHFFTKERESLLDYVATCGMMTI